MTDRWLRYMAGIVEVASYTCDGYQPVLCTIVGCDPLYYLEEEEDDPLPVA